MSQQQSKDTISIKIVEGERLLQIFLNDVLLCNYHDYGYDFMKSIAPRGDVLYWCLVSDDGMLLQQLLEQLRNGGYFNAK